MHSTFHGEETPTTRNRLGDEISFTLDQPMINYDLIKTIFALDFPAKVDIEYTKFVQARKHKKRRINKKWLKKYGYKETRVKFKGWQLETHTDGTYTFVKGVKNGSSRHGN